MVVYQYKLDVEKLKKCYPRREFYESDRFMQWACGNEGYILPKVKVVSKISDVKNGYSQNRYETLSAFKQFVGKYYKFYECEVLREN